MLFSENSLGTQNYAAFLNSPVSEVFWHGKGVVMLPGGTEKGPYVFVNFDMDSKAASAVIARMLDEVFHLKEEDIYYTIQLIAPFEKAEFGESSADYDYNANKIASNGFKQNLF